MCFVVACFVLLYVGPSLSFAIVGFASVDASLLFAFLVCDLLLGWLFIPINLK